MTLATLMIGATFVLGILLLLAGCAAVLRGRVRSGGGTLKVGGIEVSGKNGATMILVIGAAFVASGFGWASTQQEATEQHERADSESEQKNVAIGVAEKARIELVKADEAAAEVEKQRLQFRDTLKSSMPDDRFRAIESTAPFLKGARAWHPPPELLRPIGSVRASNR